MSSSHTPPGYASVAPYLIVDGASATIEFLVRVFDAVELRRFPNAAGKLNHAEVRTGRGGRMRARLPAVWIVIGLAALALTPSAQSASATPITIVRSFYDAVNARQLDKAMTYVADNALFVWAGVGTYSGKAKVGELLQDTGRRGWTWNGSNFRNSGGRVTYAFQLYEHGNLIYSAKDGVTIVKAGKIVFDGTEATAPR